MMGQFFAQLGTMAYFRIKRTEIAAEFCVNKDKPASCCAGKCYLGKQLGGLQHDQDQAGGMNENELPYFILPDLLMVSAANKEAAVHAGRYRLGHSLCWHTENEQPPEA